MPRLRGAMGGRVGGVALGLSVPKGVVGVCSGPSLVAPSVNLRGQRRGFFKLPQFDAYPRKKTKDGPACYRPSHSRALKLMKPPYPKPGPDYSKMVPKPIVPGMTKDLFLWLNGHTYFQFADQFSSWEDLFTCDYETLRKTKNIPHDKAWRLLKKLDLYRRGQMVTHRVKAPTQWQFQPTPGQGSHVFPIPDPHSPRNFLISVTESSKKQKDLLDKQLRRERIRKVEEDLKRLRASQAKGPKKVIGPAGTVKRDLEEEEHAGMDILSSHMSRQKAELLQQANRGRSTRGRATFKDVRELIVEAKLKSLRAARQSARRAEILRKRQSLKIGEDDEEEINTNIGPDLPSEQR